MIRKGHNRGRDEHAPVAVERQQGQGSEHMKMRFNAAARYVNQEGGLQQLADRNDVSCQRCPWTAQDAKPWVAPKQSAQNYSGQYMLMQHPPLADPRERRPY